MSKYPYLIQKRRKSVWRVRFAIPEGLRELLDGRCKYCRSIDEKDVCRAVLVACASTIKYTLGYLGMSKKSAK